MDATILGEVLTTLTGTAGAVKSIAEAVKATKAKVKGNTEAERAVAEVDGLERLTKPGMWR